MMKTQQTEALQKAQSALRGLSFKDEKITSALESISRALDCSADQPTEPAQPATQAGAGELVESIMATAAHWAHMAQIDNGDAAEVAKHDLWRKLARLAAPTTEQPGDVAAKRLQYALDMLVAAGHVRKEKVDFALAWAAESMI